MPILSKGLHHLFCLILEATKPRDLRRSAGHRADRSGEEELFGSTSTLQEKNLPVRIGARRKQSHSAVFKGLRKERERVLSGSLNPT